MSNSTRTHKNRGNHLVSISAIVVMFAALGLMACELPHSEYPGDGGSLRITIGSEISRSLLPELNMDPAEYSITGNGPDGAHFETTTVEGSAEFHDLDTGEWAIKVSAFNIDGIEIGYGENSVMIEKGLLNTVAIDVRPFSGTGSLSLSASWDAEAVKAPGVSASLTNPEGEIFELQFVTGTGHAEYTDDQIDSGYYTLVLQLFDGEDVVAGVVETVRIVKDSHTEGNFVFDDLNHPTGDVSIVATVDLEEPLDVEVIGVSAVLEYGTLMNPELTVSNSNGADLNYRWYLNGDVVGEGETVSIGDGLRRGYYRLDVVVFSADGLRSGSASHEFTVE